MGRGKGLPKAPYVKPLPNDMVSAKFAYDLVSSFKDECEMLREKLQQAEKENERLRIELLKYRNSNIKN